MTNFRGSDSDHLINGLATNRTSASLQSMPTSPTQAS